MPATRPMFAAAAATLPCAFTAAAVTSLDLDAMPHGTVIAAPVNGVTVTVDNPNDGAPDVATVFDYNGVPRAAAGGHQWPWKGGNIAANTDLGNGLVLAGLPGRFFETRSPVGAFTFEFPVDVVRFDFTIVDHEPGETNTSTGYFVGLFSGGAPVATIGFSDLTNPASVWYDPTVSFGDGTANALSFKASAAGAKSFDTAVVALGGSGGLAQLSYEPVPTPTALLAGVALLSAATLRRRR